MNLALALIAHGVDCCPMDGFELLTVGRLLNLPRAGQSVTLIASGRGDAGGVIPQIRCCRARYTKRTQPGETTIDHRVAASFCSGEITRVDWREASNTVAAKTICATTAGQ